MNDASAHIDPGTSSMLLQVIVGALVVGITIKVYWGKITAGTREAPGLPYKPQFLC